MTIDEAIECERNHRLYPEYHEQLAEWLEELKAYRTLDKTNFSDGYNRAIDDFAKDICKMIVQSENNGNYRFYAVEIKQAIADIAEQLKAGEAE